MSDDGGGLRHAAAPTVRRNGFVDMTGHKIGAWTVLRMGASSPNGAARWVCQCSCGAQHLIVGKRLRGARISRCCWRCAVAARGPRTGHAKGGAKPLPIGVPSPRAYTISTRRVCKRDLASLAMEYPVAEHASYDRPVTRADCLPGGSNAARPCPWASCVHHLALDVHKRTGNILVNLPRTDVADMRETCSLDLADAGETTLDAIGAALGVSKEAIRLIELRALSHLQVMADRAAVDYLDESVTGPHPYGRPAALRVRRGDDAGVVFTSLLGASGRCR